MAAVNIAQNSRAKTVAIVSTTENQEDTVYTCPSNCRAHMSLLYVSNHDNAATDFEIMWDRADGTDAFIIAGKNLGVGEFLQWSDGFIVFEPGDALKVTPSNNSTPDLTTFATVEEFFSLT